MLLISTPGFCQTDICGPVLDLLIDEAGDRTDLNVIHAEVYVDPSDFATGGFPELTPAVNAMALPFESALGSTPPSTAANSTTRYRSSDQRSENDKRLAEAGRWSGPCPDRRDRVQLNDWPQPQVRWALGLSIEKPASWRPSL